MHAPHAAGTTNSCSLNERERARDGPRSLRTAPHQEVQGGFLLDVVVRERLAGLEYLTREDQHLSIGRDPLLFVDLRLDVSIVSVGSTSSVIVLPAGVLTKICIASAAAAPGPRMTSEVATATTSTRQNPSRERAGRSTSPCPPGVPQAATGARAAVRSGAERPAAALSVPRARPPGPQSPESRAEARAFISRHGSSQTTPPPGSGGTSAVAGNQHPAPALGDRRIVTIGR
jgi:hypothetical protein